MSTVAILAERLDIDVERTYRQRLQDGTDKIIKASFSAGDIVASIIHYDGYPYLDGSDLGVVSYLRDHIETWEAYPLGGNRCHIRIDNDYFGDPVPKVFKDRLSFDTWCKEYFAADYLYWITGPMSLKWCWLFHFNREHYVPGKIDYSEPNGPWKYCGKYDN